MSTFDIMSVSYTDRCPRRKKCWTILKKYGLNSITGAAGGKNGTPTVKPASAAGKGSNGKGKKRDLGYAQAEQDDTVETPSKKAKVEAETENGDLNVGD